MIDSRAQFNDAWGDDITDERKTTLEDLLRAWELQADHGDAMGAYERVKLTGADVFWLAARSLAGGDDDGIIAGKVERLQRAKLRPNLGLTLSMEKLNLRGADMAGAHLEGATLAGACLEGASLAGAHLGGAILIEAHLEGANLRDSHLEHADLGAAHLERASLSDAYVQSANLRAAHLADAVLIGSHLEEAIFRGAHLEKVDLGGGHLRGAILEGAYLQAAFLRAAHLEDSDLCSARLEGAICNNTYLEGALLRRAHLEGALLSSARLTGADLSEAHLEGADLGAAHLENANLSGARLEGTSLRAAHLEGATLIGAHLEGRLYDAEEVDFHRIRERVPDFSTVQEPTDLRDSYFDHATNCTNLILGKAGIGEEAGYVRVADVRWGGVNLAVVGLWPAAMRLGDERVARAWRLPESMSAQDAPAIGDEPSHLSWEVPAPMSVGSEAARKPGLDETEPAHERLDLFRSAVRANRQITKALRDQGMNDEADRFAYRAQVCHRQVLHLQGDHSRAIGSWLLDLVSGYGYRPLRSVVTYVLVIALFAAMYYFNGRFAIPHLRWDEALVLSVNSFHGRGFFTSSIQLGDTLARLAAIEAILGLLIEVTVIATFTQRFFAR